MSPAPWTEFFQSRKYGEPIVIVSGLPRSGTSMMMGMLAAGGLELVVDNLRQADVDNPKGYYEYEPVKELDKGGDKSWLRQCRGKGIKIVSSLLRYLPGDNRYRIVFMHRDLGEVLASQNKMINHRGEQNPATDEKMVENYKGHLNRTRLMFDSLSCFSVLDVNYKDVVENRREQAGRVRDFVGSRLDLEKMVGVVDDQLYRNRR